MMKKLLSIWAMLLLCTYISAQNNYQKVTIFGSNDEVNQLVQAGYNFDHASFRPGVSATTILSESNVEAIQSMGYNVKVEIENISDFYKNRALQDPMHPKNMKNAQCSGGSASVDPETKYGTPDNFSLGSMGGYLTYQEFLDNLDSMASKYPNLITVKQPIGTYTTHQGRPIYWVRISDNPNSDEPEPETLYSAIHHAREPASLSQLIFYMWHMLENYDTDPEIQYLVNETEMYFVPLLNPDGYIINETIEPNGGGMWRKNARDNDNDGVIGINGTQEDASDGVDLNRNYSYHYGASGVSTDPSQETYLGPNTFSEPETQAMKWFCEQRDFNFALNAHTYGDLLLHPFGWDNNDFAADHNYFQSITHYMVKENNYLAQKSSDLYPAAGDSDDWMYDGDLGTKPKIFAMTPEIGSDDDGFWPAPSRIIPICKDNIFQNKMNAHLLKKYASIEETGDPRVDATSNYIYYDLQRLGLESGSFDVSLTPISGVSAVGPNNTHAGMNILDMESDSISFTVDAGVQTGDAIKLVLNLDNGDWVYRDTIEKIYGIPGSIYNDDLSNMGNWISNDWGITSEDYFSASTCLTDSPNSNYPFSNANTEAELDMTFDLFNATSALVRFRAKWDIEANYDYVQFMVSTDNGSNWTPQCGLYTNPGTSNQVSGEPLYDGQQPDWVLEEINLSDYLGQQIRFKFILIGDLYANGDGYYVDDFEVFADYTNSIEEVSENFNIYPNPSKGTVRIQSTSGIHQVNVLNSVGQVVYAASENFGQKATLQLESLSNGVYFIQIKDEEGKVSVQKLILSK